MVAAAIFPAPASAAPRNDNFRDAQAIQLGTAVRGTINGATKEPGEPRHAGSLAGRSVWYGLRVKRTATVSLNTCGASFDSVLAAYSGGLLRSLEVIKFNDNGCGRGGGTGSRIAFTARRRQIYWIAVAGFAPRGSFRLRVTRLDAPRNDNFAAAVPIGLGESIVGTARDATRERGEPTHGIEGVHTVWFRFRVATGQAVRLDACGGDHPPRMVVYAGRRVDRLTRRAGVDQCFVVFFAQAGADYRVVLVESGRGLGFRLRLRAARPPANDNFANATEITLGSRTPATTRDATREPGEPVAFNNYPLTVWFHLAIPAGTEVQITACPTGTSQIDVFAGAELDRLTFIGFLSCRIGLRARSEPVDFYIRVTSLRDADFDVMAEAVTTPP